MDLETQVFKVIRGVRSFRLAGENLTVPDGPDESLALYAKNGVDKVCDVTVSETDGGQRITCHLPSGEDLPVGTYKVRLASHGLDPTDPLTVATLTVSLVEAVPGPIATSPDGLSKVKTLNGKASLDELEPVSSGGGFTMTGDGLARYVGAAPFLVWGEGDDEKVEISGIAAGSGGAITASIGSAEVVLPVGTTTCHLTFGDGDEAIDIGPFKVTRAE